MTDLLNGLGAAAPFLIFLLATGESAAFLGLFVPGEVAVILGGVMAGTGHTPLWAVGVAAVLGAVAGDSIGYWMGDRFGPALLERPRWARVADRLAAARESFGRRGWWALVVARFTSFLRAIVPFAAGMARMPYRTFLLGNVIGAALWGVAFTLVGFVAGNRWPVVERWARTGGLVLLGILVIVASIVAATRWLSAHPDRVQARLAPLLHTRLGVMLGRLAAIPYRGLRPFLVLWPAGLVTVAAFWLFGTLLQDVLNREDFFLFDSAALRYPATHQVQWLTTLARGVSAATMPIVIGGATLLVALVLARKRHAWAGLAVLVAVGGQWLIVETTQALVDRSPPAFVPLASRLDYGFPSEHMAALAALLVVALWPWRRSTWAAGVIRYGTASVAVALVASARLVLLIEYPSDVIAGTTAGLAWALLVTVLVAWHRRPARSEALQVSGLGSRAHPG